MENLIIPSPVWPALDLDLVIPSYMMAYICTLTARPPYHANLEPIRRTASTSAYHMYSLIGPLHWSNTAIFSDCYIRRYCVHYIDQVSDLLQAARVSIVLP